MFKAAYPMFYETVRQARAVHTERVKSHCRAIARATWKVKQAKKPADNFRICKRLWRGIRDINHAYKRRCDW